MSRVPRAALLQTAALFSQLVNYLYLVKDYVVKKIFQTLNFLWFFASPGGLLGVVGDRVTASPRGLCGRPGVDCFGQLLSGFVIS